MKNRQHTLWEREYQEAKLPSSHRDSISHSIKYLVGFLQEQDVCLEHGRVLDVGCGNGRNLTWFAEHGMDAHGVDIAENALKMARSRASNQGLEENVSLYQQSMTDTYPFEDEFFDIVLCTTSLENLFTDEVVQVFREEVERVMSSKGYLLLYYLTPEDEHCQAFAEDNADRVMEMPETGIKQRMYTEGEVQDFLGEEFALLDSQDFDFEDKIAGKTYKRHLKANIWQKD